MYLPRLRASEIPLEKALAEEEKITKSFLGVKGLLPRRGRRITKQAYLTPNVP
jgi:hypothetical protein